MNVNHRFLLYPALWVKVIMHFVYFLKSQKTKFHYVGATHNLDKRIELHNNGKISSTQKYAPLTLVYYEAYLDEKDALS